jgi:uncharacterized membrane protein (DUF373 family)
MAAMDRDNDSLPPDARAKDSGGGPIMRALTIGEKALAFLVAFILLALAVALLGSLVTEFARAHGSILVRVINAFDGLLLVVILLEVYATVRVHLEGGGFQLEPFLVVGGIAIVRHILAIAAKIVVTGETLAQSRALLVDLSVSVGALFFFVLALVLARWSGRWANATKGDFG